MYIAVRHATGFDAAWFSWDLWDRRPGSSPEPTSTQDLDPDMPESVRLVPSGAIPVGLVQGGKLGSLEVWKDIILCVLRDSVGLW